MILHYPVPLIVRMRWAADTEDAGGSSDISAKQRRSGLHNDETQYHHPVKDGGEGGRGGRAQWIRW
jgi:hypothetical protein